MLFRSGGLTGSMAMPGRRPAQTPCAYRGARETGQAPCYAMERTVFPVRVHSPVRFIPALRIGRARVGIEPGKVGQDWCSRAPVRLHGPVYPEPPPHTSPPVAAPRTRLPVRVLAPVSPVPAPHIKPTVRLDRKSTRLNSSHGIGSRMPSSA